MKRSPLAAESDFEGVPNNRGEGDIRGSRESVVCLELGVLFDGVRYGEQDERRG